MRAWLLAITLVACRPSTPPPAADAAPPPSDAGAAVATADASPSSEDAAATAQADAAPEPSTTGSTTHARPDGGGGLLEGMVREARIVSLDESSDGKTVEVSRGQMVVLLLAASPTSGFDWAVVKAPPALGEPIMGYVSGGEQMGASGKRRFTWKLGGALPAGDQAVELAYRRSFEQGVPPQKTFRFKVRAAR